MYWNELTDKHKDAFLKLVNDILNGTADVEDKTLEETLGDYSQEEE